MDGNIQIKPSDSFVSLEEMIGSGGFGTVYKGEWSGSHVAIKVLACQHLDKETSEEFIREIELMSSLRSPKLIQVYGGVFEKGSMAIVMELVSNGNLYEQLRDNESLPWTIKYNIATDIAYGLTYLHDRSIIHRDLKSMNVLLDDNLNAKISDFGLAQVKTQSQLIATMGRCVGRILWMAPELFGRKAKNTEKSDVYALGMVLYELLTHKLPFQDDLVGKKAEAVIPGWLKDGDRPDIPNYGANSFKDLIEQCWHQDSDTRPTAEQVAQRLEQMTTNESIQAAAGGAPKEELKEVNLPLSTTQNGPSSVESASHGIAQLPLSTKDINPMPLSVFAPPAKPAPEVPAIDQGQVNKLLDHVMRGEQDEAENMIKANPQLLNHKGSGKEFHNDREFRSITPFQYALWALDSYMWEMMMKHIDHSEAQSQLEELETQGTEHGKQFDGFDSLINAYQVFLNNYISWYNRQRMNYWCEEVGGAQKGLPVHALQWYYRPGRWTYDEWVAKIATRCGLGVALGLISGDVYGYPLPTSCDGTSTINAMLRTANSAHSNATIGSLLGWQKYIPLAMECDCDRVASLKNILNSEYKDLKDTLSKAPGLRIR